MVALTGLMAWQATSRDPDRARSVTGVVLLLAALSVLAGAGPGA
jgi:hypothetical protein